MGGFPIVLHEAEKVPSSGASKSEQDASDMAVTTVGGAEVGSRWPGDHTYELHTGTMIWDCANYQFCMLESKHGVIDRLISGGPWDMYGCIAHCEKLGPECLGVDMQSFDHKFNKYNGAKGDSYNKHARINNCVFFRDGFGSQIPGCTKNEQYVSCRRRGRGSDAPRAGKMPVAKQLPVAVTTSADVEPVAVDAQKDSLTKNLFSSKQSIEAKPSIEEAEKLA